MKTKQSELVATIQTGIENKVIEIKVSYDIGGINYYNGGRDRRGYYIIATPVTYKNGCKSFILFSGIKECILECKAFNAKKFYSIVDNVKECDYQHLIQHVLEKGKY